MFAQTRTAQEKHASFVNREMAGVHQNQYSGRVPQGDTQQAGGLDEDR
jgi:hypothetical protein